MWDNAVREVKVAQALKLFRFQRLQKGDISLRDSFDFIYYRRYEKVQSNKLSRTVKIVCTDRLSCGRWEKIA